MVDRIPENHNPDTRPYDDRNLGPTGPTVVEAGRTGTGGWAVAVVLAVLVAAGVFYFSSGTPGDGVDPNANTSAIETQDPAATGTIPLESQPAETQPTETTPAVPAE